DLGALVCTPRTPLCLICPVAGDCRERGMGIQEEVPVMTRRPPPLKVQEACALVTREKRWLIVQRAPQGLWGGFWEFPTIHRSGADPAGRSFGAPVELAEGVRRLTGVRATIGPLVTTVRFGVTRHRVELAAHLGYGLTEALTAGPGLVQAAWEAPEALV